MVAVEKERFPSCRKNKFMSRAYGPFKVLERIDESAYKIDLPREFGVSPTFNVGDLSPYLEDEDLSNLRANLKQPWRMMLEHSIQSNNP